MSVKKVHNNQPKEFKFSAENLKKVEEILKRYPEKNKKSAVVKNRIADLKESIKENSFIENLDTE